ncbi:hypothetical protein QA634_19060 [Methylobacterium sp. CB376]|uniref:hypothetical protein n=1 Tax=unclassified Methylobacterium TaxID=2615210 RepID=UPI0012374F2F|nr:MULTISPECIES: hypothetical protein [Methylobacterium]WFT77436.1 hypothetical protein QA634_19060 [Methylobacterium nodulans]
MRRITRVSFSRSSRAQDQHAPPREDVVHEAREGQGEAAHVQRRQDDRPGARRHALEHPALQDGDVGGVGHQGLARP